jgi:hypothetical protein
LQSATTLGYTVAVNPSTSARTGTLTVGNQPVTITQAANANSTYLVGSVYPSWGDSLNTFGDGTLNTLDLISVLRAVTNIPGYVPLSCSDLFDAMDSYPVDTTTMRGGDGILNTLDLIELLRRVTNIDASRPTRTSRGLSCAAAAPQSRRPDAGGSEGALELGPADPSGVQPGVPIYLRANSDLSLAGLSFSLGCDACQLDYTAPDDQPPSLVDKGLAGKLAVAWLGRLEEKAGGKILLGYVTTNVPFQSLRFYGVSANASGSGRSVPIGFGQAR